MPRALRRLLHLLALTLCLLQMTGLVDRLAPPPCDGACPDDDAETDCGPDCMACNCCAHLPSEIVMSSPGPCAGVAESRNSEAALPALAQGEPRGIEHVPRA